MAFDNFANFAEATFTGTNVTDTTFNLTTFTNLPSGQFNASIYDSTAYNAPHLDPNVEVVRVTGYMGGDAITGVVRAQEGTTAAAHDTGSNTYTLLATMTAKTMNDLVSGVTPGIIDFDITQVQLPSANPAVLSLTERTPKVLFDDTTAEIVNWGGKIVPKDFGFNPKAEILYSMSSTQTSDNHILWRVYVDAFTPNSTATDWGIESYDVANTGSGVLNHLQTGGHIKRVSIPLTYLDSANTGDFFFVKLDRFSGDAQKATGDAELLHFQISYDRLN